LLAAFSSLVPVPDANGWVSVERPPHQSAFEHAGDEDDPDIWVLFSKQSGVEKFMVRFPEDPIYRYLEDGSLEISASRNGEAHLLQVLEGASADELERRASAIAVQPGILLVEMERASSGALELCYLAGDQWTRERYFLTPHHLFVLQTKSSDFHSENHRYFSDSLDVDF
jgi:hypothetical protein